MLSEKVKQVLRKYTDQDILSTLLSRGYPEQEVLVTLGIVNLLKDDSDNAIRFLDKANSLGENPDEKDIEFEKHFYLGVANYRLKNFKESIGSFEKAYKIDSYSPAVLNNLAVLRFYERVHEQSTSIEMLELALQMYPNYIDAKLNLEYIRKNNLEHLKITERILDIQLYKRKQYIV